jgi:anthranilate phosphoribosyltransferase
LEPLLAAPRKFADIIRKCLSGMSMPTRLYVLLAMLFVLVIAAEIL